MQFKEGMGLTNEYCENYPDAFLFDDDALARLREKLAPIFAANPVIEEIAVFANSVPYTLLAGAVDSDGEVVYVDGETSYTEYDPSDGYWEVDTIAVYKTGEATIRFYGKYTGEPMEAFLGGTIL